MADTQPSTTVLTAHLDGEAVLLEMDRKRYFRLNETGQVIWRVFEAGETGDAAVTALLEEFEVDAATARAEVERFVADLAAEGLIRTPHRP